MKSIFERDIDRCTHLTVHTGMCTFCGMMVCDGCLLDHKSLHAKKGDRMIPKEEYDG